MTDKEITIIEKIKGYNQEKMILVTALTGKGYTYRMDRYQRRLREIDEALSKLKNV